MPDFTEFAKFAPNLTHPLVLAGFGLLLVFGFLRAFLASPIMPKVRRRRGVLKVSSR